MTIMTRQQYISRILEAICGTTPASPSVYYGVVRMADDAERVVQFDSEPVTPDNK